MRHLDAMRLELLKSLPPIPIQIESQDDPELHEKPEEAASIGRLLGGRVQADDGTMQPPLDESDKNILRGIKSRRQA